MTTTEIVPADNMAALEALDPQQQAMAVTSMLTEARSWLAHAKEATEPRTIANFKAQMATVAEASKQLGLSKEIQIDAVEMVRRAEHGVGVAIRKGQAAGEIRGIGERTRPGNQRGFAATDDSSSCKPGPYDFAARGELHGNAGANIYAMTDGVSDEQFEEAITEAKEMGDLSRANVARRSKAKAQPEVPKSDATPRRTAPKISGGPKRNSTEMLENVNGMLQGIVQTLQYIDPADVDTDAAPALIAQIRESLNRIRKTTKEIENV